MAFKGFGKGAQRFFMDLAANNDKGWFLENQARYEQELLEPAVAFVETLGPRLALLGGQTPVQAEPRGRVLDRLGEEGGTPVLLPERGGRESALLLRPAQVPEARSRALSCRGRRRGRRDCPDEDAAEAREKSLRVFEEPAYKRIPQGFPGDHRRGDLLRYNGIGVSTDIPRTALTSADLVDLCADFASTVRPLIEWLGALNG